MYFSQQSYKFSNKIEDTDTAAFTVHWFYFVAFIFRNFTMNTNNFYEKKIPVNFTLVSIFCRKHLTL